MSRPPSRRRAPTGALLGPFIGRSLARDRGQRVLTVCGWALLAYALAYVWAGLDAGPLPRRRRSPAPTWLAAPGPTYNHRPT